MCGVNTRVFHRFGLDIVREVLPVFPEEAVQICLLDVARGGRVVMGPASKRALECRVVEFGRTVKREIGVGSQVVRLALGISTTS
jgi:hypothetical protein